VVSIERIVGVAEDFGDRQIVNGIDDEQQRAFFAHVFPDRIAHAGEDARERIGFGGRRLEKVEDVCDGFVIILDAQRGLLGGQFLRLLGLLASLRAGAEIQVAHAGPDDQHHQHQQRQMGEQDFASESSCGEIHGLCGAVSITAVNMKTRIPGDNVWNDTCCNNHRRLQTFPTLQTVDIIRGLTGRMPVALPPFCERGGTAMKRWNQPKTWTAATAASAMIVSMVIATPAAAQTRPMPPDPYAPATNVSAAQQQQPEAMSAPTSYGGYGPYPRDYPATEVNAVPYAKARQVIARAE